MEQQQQEDIDQQAIALDGKPNYFLLCKYDLVRIITDVYKVKLKYAYVRPKNDLIEILQRLDGGEDPANIPTK